MKKIPLGPNLRLHAKKVLREILKKIRELNGV